MLEEQMGTFFHVQKIVRQGSHVHAVGGFEVQREPDTQNATLRQRDHMFKQTATVTWGKVVTGFMVIISLGILVFFLEPTFLPCPFILSWLFQLFLLSRWVCVLKQVILSFPLIHQSFCCVFLCLLFNKKKNNSLQTTFTFLFSGSDQHLHPHR